METHRASACHFETCSINPTTTKRMKISVFPTLLLIIVVVAIGYLAYDMAHSRADASELLVGIVTGFSVLLTLGCVIGISLKNSRMNINMKAWSIAAFVVMTIVYLCFAGFGVSMPYYIIVLALLLVIHLWVVWKLSTVEVK